MPDCTVSPGSGFILPVRTSRMVSLVNGACRSTSGKGKGSSGTWCGMLGCWQVGVGRCGLMQTERINNEYSKCLTYPTEISRPAPLDGFEPKSSYSVFCGVGVKANPHSPLSFQEKMSDPNTDNLITPNGLTNQPLPRLRHFVRPRDARISFRDPKCGRPLVDSQLICIFT